MKRFPAAILPVLLLSICLAVAGCGTSSAGSSTSSTSPTATPAATATATAVSSNPTSVPVASVAECGKLLSLSQANQYTNPPSPATAIYPVQTSSGALCFYETPKFQTNVGMVFKAYTGGTLSSGVQAAASSSLSDVSIISTQPVTGLGSQALFVQDTGKSTSNGTSVNANENILFVVDGSVVFGIINIIYNGVDPLGSATPATVLSDFEQIARVVIGNL